MPQGWIHIVAGQVPHCNLLVAGVSCKDLSRANSKHSNKKALLRTAGSPGGTVATYRAFLEYLAYQAPETFIVENSDAMADESSSDDSNINIFLVDARERGYEAQPVIVDCQDYGAPARRKRIYIYGIKVVSASGLDVWGGFWSDLRLPCPSLGKQVGLTLSKLCN